MRERFKGLEIEGLGERTVLLTTAPLFWQYCLHSYFVRVKSALPSPATVTGLDEFFAPSCQAVTL